MRARRLRLPEQVPNINCLTGEAMLSSNHARTAHALAFTSNIKEAEYAL